MRKISEDKNFLCATVHLDRNDIDEIVDILNRKGNKLEIISDGYEFESIDELVKKRGDNISNLHLSVHNPYISLRLLDKGMLPPRNFLYSTTSDEVFYKIKEVLLKKRSFVGKILPGWISFLCIPAVLVIPSRIIIQLLPPGKELILLFFISLFTLVPALFHFGYFSTISLQPTAQKKNFWVRNQDTILVSIITIFLTLVIQYCWKLLFK